MVLTSGLPPHSMFFFDNFCFRGGHGGHGGHGQAIERILTLTRSGVRLQLYGSYRRAARCPTNSLKLVCAAACPEGVADEAASGGGRRASAFT